MKEYMVRLKASVYYDVKIEAQEEDGAQGIAINKFAELIDQVKLPSPLAFDYIETWEIEEENN